MKPCFEALRGEGREIWVLDLAQEPLEDVLEAKARLPLAFVLGSEQLEIEEEWT